MHVSASASAATAITTHLDPREKVSDSTTGAWSYTRSSFAPSALQPRRPTQTDHHRLPQYLRSDRNYARTRVRPYVISANDLATLKQATTNLRNEVCDVVIHDLTTDRAPDQRTGTTPLTFVGYLDEEMWEQMRQIIDP